MYVLILLAQCLLWELTCSYTTYDQRQDGPWNLEIDVKNVNIFALMKGNKEEYVEYDYAYDYSEMTIKPPNGTKPKPTNSTTTSTEIPSVNTTNMTTENFIDVKKNNTVVDAEVIMTTLPLKNYTLTGVDVSLEANSTTAVPTTLALKNDTITSVDAPFQANKTAAVTTSITNCKKGFVQNSNGNCELEMQGTSNALRKLVKLSQKLKWRRANHHTKEEST
ncbi:uncharacterized protein LOC115454425 [Manduca sexta]|uniref:uncharacterized protein LOC115454425 n=1 Tax=Manduca sexta TaxID=7130 RepID=UPI001181C9C6|nr:uncharacterized protein LOC115454425 [Manduca sexta]